MNSNIKIVADSSADLQALADVAFASVPLKIVAADREFVDDAALNVEEMVNYLSTYHGRSSTSCPNPEDYLHAFGDAQFVFCITITATLSGSYNAAMLAKKLYEEQYPDRRVFVVNSLSTGPEMALIADKVREGILAGLTFDEICREATEYGQKTGLLFVLESMRNLVNNGRVSPLAATMAGLLGIRAVGRASDRGDLEMLDKCRGEKRMLDTMIKRLAELGFCGGRIRITHCFNEETAIALRDRVLAAFEGSTVEIARCSALCSFYAERGGLLIGFEKGKEN